MDRELYRDMENVPLNMWKAEEVLWSEYLKLASRSAITSSETGKSLTITDPQFTLLENWYVTYLLGLNGIASGKGISIVKLLSILICQINFGFTICYDLCGYYVRNIQQLKTLNKTADLQFSVTISHVI